jgi:hypothetical protein
LIFTRFDPDKPDQRERMLTSPSLYGVEDGNRVRPDRGNVADWSARARVRKRYCNRRVADRAIGVPGAFGGLRLVFMPPEWFWADASTKIIFVCCHRSSTVTADEAAMLSTVRRYGELPAKRLS